MSGWLGVEWRCALFLLGMVPWLSASADTSPWRTASLPLAEERELHSQHTGREYRIYLSVPPGQPPAQGYPVIYVLDGNLLFPALLPQSRMFQPNAFRGGREPVVLVGIGYPTDEAFDVQARAEDYTPPAADMGDTGDRLSSRHGGAERFLAFIENELKPLVEARYPIDRGRQTLFGHSYGGLFTVYTLLSRPQAFQRYLASSPSLWWKQRYIFSLLPAAKGARSLRSGEPRLLLSVGDGEQPAGDPARQDERLLHQARRRIVDNARDLDAALTRLGFVSELRIQAHGDHASTAFISAAQVLEFATD
ncbi:alpha/beta hydrolase [Phytopseudomonas dryadis]|uniref:Alpha/beta hydrolase n=1 Tax=Phytopseudomonas dryadis TaxID=2487520 RepID=A0ABY1ZA28_9GAMM|nr:MULTISPECIES: alpha/beta hydrolase-fold protein [Pseudomonas]TBV08566.1 alpha/beta hydrolase [Pseudomonas dryadis]TBV18934.1 alpha/beta hydrolase [Pseudomonas sp. FRB 230]